MIAVSSLVPHGRTMRPPVVLVHGAANSAPVWTFWQRELAGYGYASHAVDLRGHGASPTTDLSHTSMRDYADDVTSVMAQLRSPAVLIGWSMGGLAAMIAAERAAKSEAPIACIGLGPSTPSGRVDLGIELRPGEFDAAEYGITSDDPDDQPAMPDLDRGERLIALASLGKESRYARDERAAGIVIDALPCPLLIVTSTADSQWPRRRYDGLSLPAEHRTIDGASHWGLVLNQRVMRTLAPMLIEWIEQQA